MVITMSLIWNKISDLAVKFEQKFSQSGEPVSVNTHKYSWYNALYGSLRYRRAHVEIVDKRDSHGIYILHTTVFPHYNDPSPIWGFDAVCGERKITGAFHDFSSAGDPEHSMYKWFNQQVADMDWSKPRQLPDWARQIFSPSMIAAGNIQEEQEVDMLCNLAETTLDYYLANVGFTQTCGADFHMAQNRYCYYQKQNPQVPKSMISMGVSQEIITEFMDEVLFPEVV